jgi:hypothetical protein
MTGTLVAVLIAIALIALAIVVLTTKTGQGGAAWPFYSKKLLSKPEQVLYHRLVKALPECIVLAQVQLSRFLGVSRGRNFAQWNNRINRLSIDFLVCLKDSTVVAAIELDDSSHDRLDRKEADLRKERAITSAGIPLLRWSVKDLPGELAIQAAIRDRTASPAREPWIAQ